MYSTAAKVTFLGLYISASLSTRSSGTFTTPTFGCASVVGYTVVGMFWPVRALNTVVLPEFASPTMPIFIDHLLFQCWVERVSDLGLRWFMDLLVLVPAEVSLLEPVQIRDCGQVFVFSSASDLLRYTGVSVTGSENSPLSALWSPAAASAVGNGCMRLSWGKRALSPRISMITSL